MKYEFKRPCLNCQALPSSMKFKELHLYGDIFLSTVQCEECEWVYIPPGDNDIVGAFDKRGDCSDPYDFRE